MWIQWKFLMFGRKWNINGNCFIHDEYDDRVDCLLQCTHNLAQNSNSMGNVCDGIWTRSNITVWVAIFKSEWVRPLQFGYLHFALRYKYEIYACICPKGNPSNFILIESNRIERQKKSNETKMKHKHFTLRLRYHGNCILNSKR